MLAGLSDGGGSGDGGGSDADGRTRGGRALGSLGSLRGPGRSAHRGGPRAGAGRRAALRRATPGRRRQALRRRAGPRARRSSRRSASSRPAPRATRSCSSPPIPPCRATGRCMQRVQERASEIRNTLVFFELEWVGLDDAAAGALLAAPALAARRHFLASMRRYRPHVLAENEEKLIEDLANTGRRAFSRLFDEMVAALRFQVTHAGETRELGEEEVLSLLYAPERELRREAARALTQGLRDNARPLAFIFNTLVQDKAVDDRLRRFETPAGLPPSRQRDRRRERRRAARRLQLALPARRALLPAEGASARPPAARGLRPLRADRREGEHAQLGRGARDRGGRLPGLLARAGRRHRAPSSSGAGSTRSCARASAAAPSARRRCPACIPTCCSTTPGISAT